MSKYKLKELCDVTAQDRAEIYKYAMKRSNEIVSGQKLETKTEAQPVQLQAPPPEPPQQD